MLTFQITPTTDSVLTYHVRALLSHKNAALYYQMPSTRKALTTLGSDLMQRISNVPGV